MFLDVLHLFLKIHGQGFECRGRVQLRMPIDEEMILKHVGPVQAVLDAHDGVVNVISTDDGIIMLSLEGGCTGCSSTPMTAMQIYYSLKQIEGIEDIIFVNGELPPYMQRFIDDKLDQEAAEAEMSADSSAGGSE